MEKKFAKTIYDPLTVEHDEDAIITILCNLPTISVLAVSMTSKDWYRICQSNLVWKTLCFRDFPDQNGEARDNFDETLTEIKASWETQRYGYGFFRPTEEQNQKKLRTWEMNDFGKLDPNRVVESWKDEYKAQRCVHIIRRQIFSEMHSIRMSQRHWMVPISLKTVVLVSLTVKLLIFIFRSVAFTCSILSMVDSDSMPFPRPRSKVKFLHPIP